MASPPAPSAWRCAQAAARLAASRAFARAAHFHLLRFHRARDEVDGLARGAYRLGVSEYLRVDSRLHSWDKVQGDFGECKARQYPLPSQRERGRGEGLCSGIALTPALSRCRRRGSIGFFFYRRFFFKAFDLVFWVSFLAGFAFFVAGAFFTGFGCALAGDFASVFTFVPFVTSVTFATFVAGA